MKINNLTVQNLNGVQKKPENKTKKSLLIKKKNFSNINFRGKFIFEKVNELSVTKLNKY